MKTVPIAFAFDNNMVFPACICMSSLLMHALPDTCYDIFILYYDNLDFSQIDRLSEYYPNCRIQYRQVNDSFEASYEVRDITVPTYYRLLIPELIPEYDKILYSDVDVIFRTDLSDVYFNTDLSDCYVAGVNSLAHLIPEYKHYYDKLGLEADKIIYAGNILLNSKRIRENNIVAQFLKHAQQKYKFQDLDILNIVCQGKIKYLNPDFCLTTHLSQLAVYDRGQLLRYWSDEVIEKALEEGIVHYNGNKPWIQYCINFDIWWEHYRKSFYFDRKYYFDFFYYRLNIFDQLPLINRLNILIRYFVYGKQVL